MGLKKMNHLIEHPHVPSQNKKEQNEISFKFFYVEGEKKYHSRFQVWARKMSQHPSTCLCLQYF